MDGSGFCDKNVQKMYKFAPSIVILPFSIQKQKARYCVLYNAIDWLHQLL